MTIETFEAQVISESDLKEIQGAGAIKTFVNRAHAPIPGLGLANTFAGWAGQPTLGDIAEQHLG